MGELLEVSDGVLLWSEPRWMTNTTVVIAPGGTDCLVVDPAVNSGDLDALALALRGRGLQCSIGWSTHPHWDHVLWAESLGPDVLRYATASNADTCARRREELLEYVDKEAPGHDRELFGRLQALPKGASRLPWEEGPMAIVLEHQAHAPGHGALFFPALGILVTGDMCSDVEIPLLDLRGQDPVGDYYAALDLYEEIDGLSFFIPGHGAPGNGTELRRRIEADRYYLHDLVELRTSTDHRLAVEWLAAKHQRHTELVRDRQPGSSQHN